MFLSLLFNDAASEAKPRCLLCPDCFGDLYLDRVILSILPKNYRLRSIFFTPLADPKTLIYRQGVSKDLLDDGLSKELQDFSLWTEAASASELRLSSSALNSGHQQALSLLIYLRNATGYVRSIERLEKSISCKRKLNEGLSRFREYLSSYVASSSFIELAKEASSLSHELDELHYELSISSGTVKLRPYDGEKKLSQEAKRLFSKFVSSTFETYTPYYGSFMPHIDEAIAGLLKKEYKDLFKRLLAFVKKHSGYVDETLVKISSEAEFYLLWNEKVSGLLKSSLPLCLPSLSDDHSEDVQDLYEISLGEEKKEETILNSFHQGANESFLVVSGPNQGGKTTFARAYGALHWIFSLGLLCPCAKARLSLFTGLGTHFASKEKTEDGLGELKNDLLRLKDLLEATPNGSILIINEIFSSTSARDGLLLFKKIIPWFLEKSYRGVIVTFLDEIVTYSPSLVSFESEIASDGKSRTHKIIRRKASGEAYATSLARSYHLLKSQIERRIKK